MFNSIFDDVKQQFRSGNMVTKLIIINIAVFIVTALVKAFAPTFYHGTFIHWLALHGDLKEVLFKPWTFITSMFVHAGLGHIFWNMLIMYWFGRIVGDLIGDRHILPIYLLGGLVGGAAYVLSYQVMPGMIGSYAVGASAAIMALVIVAGLINPDHEMRLLLLGVIKIKYIIAAIVFFDLIAIGSGSNTGGHIAHIGGLLMGWVYMIQLRNGSDLAVPINNFFGKLQGQQQT
mgnify:FL=1